MSLRKNALGITNNGKMTRVGAKRWSLHPRVLVLYNLIYRTLKGSYSEKL